MEMILVSLALFLTPCLAIEVPQHGSGVSHLSGPQQQQQANSTSFVPSHPLVAQQINHQQKEQQRQFQSQPERQGAAETYFLRPPLARYQSYQPILPSAYSQHGQPLQVLNYVDYQPEDAEGQFLPYQQLLRQQESQQLFRQKLPQQLLRQEEPQQQSPSPYGSPVLEQRFIHRRAPSSEIFGSPEQGYMLTYEELQPMYPVYGPQTYSRIARQAGQ